MRRGVSIFLALLLWFSYSGLAGAVHHAYADGDGAHQHDESQCRIWAALHGPLLDEHAPAAQLPHQRQPVRVVDVADAILPANLTLNLTCRGPPLG